MKFYAPSRISENILTTPEGYLVCVGVAIARTGEMEYGPGETPIPVGEDGKTIIVRDAEDVFKSETLQSFEGKPITIMHPQTGMVTPESWKELAKGVIQNVRRGTGKNENDIVADLLITDAEAIRLVKSGLREVSCGYDADYYQTGIGRGKQTSIIGNHLALVSEGRAGSSYAINDHKGKAKTKMGKFSDSIKAIFQKAQEDAIKAATIDEVAVEVEKPAVGMDEICAAVKDLAEKVASMQNAAPAVTEVEKVEDEEVNPGLEDRLKKLEEMVAALMAKMNPTGDEEIEMEEKEKVEDENVEIEVEDEIVVEDEMEEKEDEKEKAFTGDAATELSEEDFSRAEIIAPGIKKQQSDLKAKCLRFAYATADGKKIIDQFSGGKKPDFKNVEFVNAVFVGASEILKSKRAGELAKTKTYDFQAFNSNLGQPKGAMTAEEMNKKNSEFYGQKQ